VQSAHHAGAGAGDLVDLGLGLEGYATLGRDRFEVERLAEGAAEVFPHPSREPLALGLRHLGIGEGEVAHHALLPVEVRRDQAPREAGGFRGGFERERASDGFDKAKSGELQPVTQVFGNSHDSASPSAPPGRRRLMAQGHARCQAAGPATSRHKKDLSSDPSAHVASAT
jgi:hypothetical protein